MSEQTVDLSQIRGDWHFHSRYVTHAMNQTLKRLHRTWRALRAEAPAEGEVPMSGPLMEEFLEACRQTRALTDDIRLMGDTQAAKGAKRQPKQRGKAGGRKARRARK